MKAYKKNNNTAIIDLEINKSILSGCGEESLCGLQVLCVNSL